MLDNNFVIKVLPKCIHNLFDFPPFLFIRHFLWIDSYYESIQLFIANNVFNPSFNDLQIIRISSSRKNYQVIILNFLQAINNTKIRINQRNPMRVYFFLSIAFNN